MSVVESQFVSIAEAALLLGVSRWTVGRMLEDGELPSIRVRGVHRIDLADLATWIEAQKTESVRKKSPAAQSKSPVPRVVGRPRKAPVTQQAATAAAVSR
jgi:excisionase family DNA binding protein